MGKLAKSGTVWIRKIGSRTGGPVGPDGLDVVFVDRARPHWTPKVAARDKESPAPTFHAG